MPSRARSETPYLLALSCPDRLGIVARVAQFLVEHECNIVECAQFGDPENHRFFLRTGFAPLADFSLARIQHDFAPIAAEFKMEAHFHDMSRQIPTLVLVSKFGHCLNDLVFRWRSHTLPIDLKGVVSNHADFIELAAANDLPYHHLTSTSKAEQEEQLEALAEGVELIVLARYMQILSPVFCAKHAGKIINIHHSFLPSFTGARPYHAAHKRGVKLIGATAHYVTAELDEGPIIEQATERVEHNLSVSDYIAVGRDVEALVLARAVKYHAEHRILLNGAKTVIFR